MKLFLKDIAYARSGDKGRNSNVGLIFKNKIIYDWAKINITTELLKKHLEYIVKGDIHRYELDNLNALNFVLYDSLGGGGSDSLLNDAQGKTHGQKTLLLEIDFPNEFKEYL